MFAVKCGSFTLRWVHVGWCRVQREVVSLALGKREFLCDFFFPKTAILLRSPKTRDVFNQDFIS